MQYLQMFFGFGTEFVEQFVIGKRGRRIGCQHFLTTKKDAYFLRSEKLSGAYPNPAEVIPSLDEELFFINRQALAQSLTIQIKSISRCQHGCKGLRRQSQLTFLDLFESSLHASGYLAQTINTDHGRSAFNYMHQTVHLIKDLPFIRSRLQFLNPFFYNRDIGLYFFDITREEIVTFLRHQSSPVKKTDSQKRFSLVIIAIF